MDPYEPNTYVKGDHLSAAKFNKLERAVADASVAVIGATADVVKGGRLGPTSKSISGTNLNDLHDNGFYAGSDLTNSPDGTNGWFYVQVQQNRDSDGYFTQTAKKYARSNASGDTWVRFSEGTGVLTPWTRIADPGGAADGTLRSILGSTQRISPRGAKLDGADLNFVTDAGFYSGVNMSNTPGGATDFFFLLVEAYNADSTWVQQTASEFANSSGGASSGRRAWIRQRQGDAWTAWTLLRDNNSAIDSTARANAVQQSSASASQVHAKNSGGAEVGVSYSASVTGNALVQRQSSGQVGVPTTPSATTDAASKAYVDNGLAVKITKGNNAIVYADIDPSINTAINNGAAAYASLSAKADLVSGVVPTSQLPAIAITNRVSVANQAARLALTSSQVQPGDIATQSDNGGVYLLADTDPSVASNWIIINSPTGGVASVNGQTGAVTLGKADIGLGNVDNTSDVNKPVSTAQQTALDAKAPIASPVFTGTPTAPTQAAGDNTSRLATTSFVLTNSATKAYVDARAGDKNAVTAVASATGTYALSLASSGTCTYRLTVTGSLTLTLPTPTDTANSWSVSVRITQDSTGGRTVTLPTNVKWDSGTKPTLSTAASASDWVTFVWDGSGWVGFLGAKALA